MKPPCLRNLCLCLLLLLSCSMGLTQPDREALLTHKPVVVATFSILGDLTAAIGGERITLHVLVGPDSDAHLYQPTPADSRLLRQADLVVSNGLGFEGWIDRLVVAAQYEGDIVVASRGITPIAVGTGSHAEPDPHAWHSIDNVRQYVHNIGQALQGRLPQHRDYFAAREADYLQALNTLERDLKGALSALAPQDRTIVTSHDAFAYFGAAYDLHFIAPLGMSTDSEASARNVAMLIRQIRAEGIKGIFIENITDPRLLQRISAEGGARIGGKLYSDALSPPGGPAPSYIAMMRHNLMTLITALAPDTLEAIPHD